VIHRARIVEIAQAAGSGGSASASFAGPCAAAIAVQACARRLSAEGLAVDLRCVDGDWATTARGEGLRVTVV
jgi:hypothetical protein